MVNPDVIYRVDYSFNVGSRTISGAIHVSPDANKNFSATQSGSFGTSLTGNVSSLSGIAKLTDNTNYDYGSIPITFTPDHLSCPSVCDTGLQSITYNLHENSSNASEIVWFNSHFKLQGTIPSSSFKVTVMNGTIHFGGAVLPVPTAVITFSSTANCASTTYSDNQWNTTIPLSAASHADEIFAAALAYVLPANFPQNVQGVTWTADFTSTAPSLQIQWQWGAANYLSRRNGLVFPMAGGHPDLNAMMVDPAHNTPSCNGYNNGDHAGTPENPTVKALVTGGGSGGGGSNWTGSWSSTETVMCVKQ